MSRALERLGRFAARRPWVVIGAWVSGLRRRRDLRGRLRPGPRGPVRGARARLPARHRAAGEGRRRRDGPRRGRRPHAARLVGEPLRLRRARADVAQVQDAVAALPHVLGTSDPAGALDEGRQAAVDSGVVSPDGGVALVRVQYPERQDLAPQPTWRTSRRPSTTCATRRRCGSRPAATCTSRSRQPPAGVGEALGLLVAIVILLLAFGSVVAMGLPIGTALLGLAVGAGSLSLVAYVVDIPGWAVVIGSMVGLGVGIDYALFILTRLPRAPRRGPRRRGRRRPLAGHRRPGGRLRRRHRGRGDPRSGRRPDPVHHRRRDRHLADRAGDGARLDHPAAGAARAGRPPGQRAARPAAPAHRTQPAPLAPVGRPRRTARHGVRRRRHGPAARPGRAGDRAAARLPRRGDDAAVAHRATGLRPDRGRVRPRRQRPAGHRGRPRGRPDRPRAAGLRDRGRTPGSREVSPPQVVAAQRTSPSWSPSRPPPPSPRPPATPSTGCVRRCSRRCWTAARPAPTSAARWRSSPTSATGSRSGCRGSSRPSCCCPSSC